VTSLFRLSQGSRRFFRARVSPMIRSARALSDQKSDSPDCFSFSSILCLRESGSKTPPGLEDAGFQAVYSLAVFFKHGSLLEVRIGLMTEREA
jgi:hypothetical protein